MQGGAESFNTLFLKHEMPGQQEANNFLEKVMLPQATLTAVVLLWCKQAWFTRLLSLLMDHPTFVRVTKGVFTIQFSA
ncbi:hypothetical protein P5673_018419 [Acropora cervicornis]|uniref:Uncharacterized protein n=1 Tax=Acropora cervicornis TaxID=6130 RepID=A0AAD9QD95_ACRCE|nr:hypothetical protein P5673_018419 [Acropora cervicornis]